MVADFKRVFRKGHTSYDTWLGDWWIKQSRNRAHQTAYGKIAEYVHSLGIHDPNFIVDYACGSGGALRALLNAFPSARFVGIDGSKKMLSLAGRMLNRSGFDTDFVSAREAFRAKGPRVRLLLSSLPNFALPKSKADVALFLFPNMNFSAPEKACLRTRVPGDPTVLAIARLLSRLREATDKPRKRQSIYEELLFERAMSANIHRLLKKGGLWIKTDYAEVCREGLSELMQWRTLFSESAFDAFVKDRMVRDKFEYLGNRFFRSSVVLDVYDQTKDLEDKSGGYIVSAFMAR